MPTDSLTPYTGTFPLAFLLDGETVHSAGDGTGACVIETAAGPVRVDVGQHAERRPDGTVAVHHPARP